MSLSVSDVTHSKARSRRHLNYAIVIIAVAVIASYGSVLPIFRSHLKDYLGIGDARFGLLFSIGWITSTASVLLGGQLIDRWGPRRVIHICIIGVGISMLLTAFSGKHFWSFFTANAISGAFTAPLVIAISSYLTKLFPRHRRRIISLNLASSSLGAMAFPVLAEGLLHVDEKSPMLTFAHVLHGPFLVAGFLMLGASLIYRNRPTESGTNRAPRAAAQRWHWRELLLSRRALLLAFLLAVHTTADVTLYSWMSRFLESESFASQIIAPGVILSLYAVVYIVSRAILAALPDHFGQRAFLIFPGLIGGAILIAGILSHNYLLTVGAYLLGGFCWSVECPSMVSAVMRHDFKRFGAVMAASGLITGLMLFGSMNGIGWIIEHIGEGRMWQAMLACTMGFPLVGVGGLIWTSLYDHKDTQE